MLIELLNNILQRPGVSDIALCASDYLWYRQHGCMERENYVVKQDELVDSLKRIAPKFVDSYDVIEQIKSSAKGSLPFSCALGSLRMRGDAAFAEQNLCVFLRKLAAEIPSTEALGLPVTLVSLVSTRPQGLILVTGPTGSGKSSTLASLLEHVNSFQKKHIMTLEDPIEYPLKSKSCRVTRREVGDDVPGFSLGVQNSLRHDPDIIVVGEIKDADTTRAALQASETGHLVLGTLHTNSATETVKRLYELAGGDTYTVYRHIIGNSLLAVFSQQLVPTIQPGRILAYELFINSSATRKLIREGSFDRIYAQIENDPNGGHVLMHKMLLGLIQRQQITRDNAFAVAHELALDRLQAELSTPLQLKPGVRGLQ
jgi:twitching motility protein PilT